MLDGIELHELWELFEEVIKRRASRTDTVRAGYGEMPRERFTITEKVAYIKHLLTHGRVRLFALLDDCRSRREMIVTFLALLEMIRRGLLIAQQENDFADISCEAAA